MQLGTVSEPIAAGHFKRLEVGEPTPALRHAVPIPNDLGGGWSEWNAGLWWDGEAVAISVSRSAGRDLYAASAHRILFFESRGAGSGKCLQRARPSSRTLSQPKCQIDPEHTVGTEV